MCLATEPLNDFPLQTKPRTTRRKVWELDSKLLCPVIGTCLTHKELVQIARKMRIADFEKWSEYRLHVSFVTTAETIGPVTKQLQKTLDRKYKTTITRYNKIKSSDELHSIWKKDRSSGEIPAAFWAFVTHPLVTRPQCMEAYETIHMLSHQIGAGLRADMKRLAKAESSLLQEKLESQEKDHKHAQAILSRDTKINTLENELSELRQQLSRIPRLENELEKLKNANQNTDKSKAELETLQHLNIQSEKKRIEDQQTIDSLHKQVQQLNDELTDSQAELKALEHLLQFDPQEKEEVRKCTINIDGQTILCVGGRPNLEPQYNAVVSRYQGQLLYHDGGLEDNIKRLENLLASADAVICPTDCVSHDAYWRTKRYCKRTGKPCVFIAKSGVSSFAHGITEIPMAQENLLS